MLAMKLSCIIATAAVLFIHTTESDAVPIPKFPPINTDLATPQALALAKRDGQIVYIEADSPMRGNWLEVIKKKKHNVTELKIYASDQLFENLNLKWRVHHLGGGKFALESIACRNYYISGDLDFLNGLVYTILKQEGSPADNDNVQLSVTAIDTGRDELEWMKFTTKNGAFGYGTALLTKKIKTVSGTVGFNEPYWRLYLPEVSDEFVIVDVIDNTRNSQPITYYYTIKVGMSRTNGQTITESVESSVSTEISSAFASASATLTYSQTWERQSQQTYSKEEERKFEAYVEAGSQLVVRQLLGHYGGTFDIRANCFQFIDLDSPDDSTGPPCNPGK